jgi:hypothetical protein
MTSGSTPAAPRLVGPAGPHARRVHVRVWRREAAPSYSVRPELSNVVLPSFRFCPGRFDQAARRYK